MEFLPGTGENERAIFAFFTLVSYIGPHAPYRQTERGDSYKPYLEKLLADNKAYWCFCSAETLEEERKKAESEEKTPRYAGRCRAITSAEAARRVSQGEKGIIRFKTPENIDVSFHDLIRGNLRSITIEIEGCHEQKKKNAVYVCACVVLLYHRGYRGGDISKIQRR